MQMFQTRRIGRVISGFREAGRAGSARGLGLALASAAAVVLPSVAHGDPMAAYARATATRPLDVATTRGAAAEPGARPVVTYVGAVRGTHALVGIATVKGRARAYVCDSKRVASWFDGKVKGGSVVLTSGSHRRFTVTLHRNTATGTVILADGRSHPFRASLATGRAGLYRGAAHGYVVGWILQTNKVQRGAISAISTGVLTPAPALTSSALSDGRISITPIPIPSIGSFVINFISAGGLTR
jgi:hypothetical protein